MSTMVCRLADKIARRFLPDDIQTLTDAISLAQRAVPSYDSERNPHLWLAVIAAEDRRFERHPGYDLKAMLRAAWCSLWRRHLQGASTIEQQLVRVIRGRYELTLRRKASEILLASALQLSFSKRTFMEVYLDVAYFGWRGNGLKQICRRLGLSVNNLSSQEAATIAALLKIPMPRKKSQKYLARLERRRAHILAEVRKHKEVVGL